jgi:GNAT superfamily N-acetyltransferase
MPSTDVVVRCPVHDSFRVRQVAGMFDLALSAEQVETFTAEVPGPDESWDIGLIVGPSGSGKSTIARRQWPDGYVIAREWPEDRAVVDGFSAGSIKDITGTLTAVGFSSPPHWVRPYRVLSGGEQFRCDLARAILEGGDLVVIDEFTSVVDRTVAKIGSAAIAKAIRRLGRRFVAISCHYDIVRWLEPDWVLDMQAATLQRRRLRRPGIRVDVYRTDAAAWAAFAMYHYLNAGLNRTAHCYLGMVDRQAVAFCAVLPLIGFVGRRRISRLVVRPDFQGVGIGRAVLNAVAAFYPRTSITTGHPAMIMALKNDRRWRCTSVARAGFRRQRKAIHRASFRGGAIGSSSTGRIVCSFEQSSPQGATS